MLRQKEKCFPLRTISLEELVPQDNFYRALESDLDLSFVYDLVKDTYARTMGRPSIDPVVFFKLQLILLFEGIRSERQLMETVNVNLAHRWYLGDDLQESVPDHSSLSRIRSRYGLPVFQQFFEKVVEICQTAGLDGARNFTLAIPRFEPMPRSKDLSRVGRCKPNNMSLPCLPLTPQRKQRYQRKPSRKRKKLFRTNPSG